MLQQWGMEHKHAVFGAIIAALAIAVGLVVVNACGLGDDVDKHVTPPRINPVSGVSVPSTDPGSSTPAFTVPPSPTWQVAPETTPRPETPTESASDEDPTTTTRSTPPRRTYTPTQPSRSLGTVRPSTVSAPDEESNG